MYETTDGVLVAPFSVFGGDSTFTLNILRFISIYFGWKILNIVL